MAITPTSVRVPTKSAWYSKINWAQALAMISMAGTVFNLFDLTPEQQVAVLGGITAVQSAVTAILKTYYTNTITPSSVPPTAMTE